MANAELTAEHRKVMLALGAKTFTITQAEADHTERLPGEWIGAIGHQWHTESLGDMDTPHWKQTLRELKNVLDHEAAQD